jgi:hypothetical protein
MLPELIEHTRQNLLFLKKKTGPMILCAITAHQTVTSRSCNELHELHGDFQNSTAISVTMAVYVPS